MTILVVGSSCSGKSAIAEDIATSFNNENLIYIATMHHGDESTENIISRHREMRSGKGFTTVERPVDIGGLEIPYGSVCLLECMSNLLANEMFDKDAPPDPVEKITRDLGIIKSRAESLVIVSNDVFRDSARYDEYCDAYIDNLGMLNRCAAEISDVVIESVAGIPYYHKGERLWG